MLREEVRLSSDAMRYGFAVGKVRVLETRGLDDSAYERLLDAPTFAEQKRLLSESPYGRYLENAQTAEDVERGLAEALDAFYRFLDQAALPAPVTRFFRLRYDFANLKAAAKARVLGVPMAGLLMEHGSVPLEAFGGDLTSLPEPLGSVARVLPFGAREAENGRVAAGATPSAATTPTADGEGRPSDGEYAETMAIDTAVDRAMFAALLEEAREAGSGYLLELARLAVDTANVRTLVRARVAGVRPAVVRELLIPGGTVDTPRLASIAELAPGDAALAVQRIPSLKRVSAGELQHPESLDVALDAVTAAALKRGRMGGQVGPEPVISYVFAREAEVAGLRVLLLGRLSRIDNDTLRARLRVVR